VQWGATDRHLYTNDVIGDRSVCVQIDLDSHHTKAFAGPMYHVAPDESSVIGFPLELLDITQRGYGVTPRDYDHPPELPPGMSKDEGIWKTDLRTGERTLLVSVTEVAEKMPIPPPRPDGTFYFWHSKFSAQGTRIMQVLRCLFPDGWGRRNVNVFTFRPDGTEIVRTHSHPIWGHKGGHPNWHPDGEHLIRNLRPDGTRDRLCKVPVDGSEAIVLSEAIDGGGHPTIEPRDRYIITDAMYLADGPTVKIRLIDLRDQSEEAVCVMPTMPRADQVAPFSELRLDGHPAWSRDYRKVCFQGAPEGKRQLFIADLSRAI